MIDDSSITSLVHRHHTLDAEFLAHAAAGGGADPRVQILILQDRQGAGRHRVERIRWMQEATDPILDHFRQAADV